jgi:hypothetical protein
MLICRYISFRYLHEATIPISFRFLREATGFQNKWKDPSKNILIGVGKVNSKKRFSISLNRNIQ